MKNLISFIKKYLRKILSSGFKIYVLSIEEFTRMNQRINSLENLLSEHKSQIEKLENEKYENGRKLDFIHQLNEEKTNVELIKFIVNNLFQSKSQILQDLIAAYLFPSGGYFCEIGASDGITFSNTFMLEKQFGWSGVIAEPAKIWHDNLLLNRNCLVSKKCIFGESGALVSFSEVSNPLLSTISSYSLNDQHREARDSFQQYKVETLTLLDLLRWAEAPKVIDFLSIDTEGSEFEILSAFNFSEYRFGFICVEHNFGPTRTKINELLTNAGYLQVFEKTSNWDDWYVSSELRIKLIK